MAQLFDSKGNPADPYGSFGKYGQKSQLSQYTDVGTGIANAYLGYKNLQLGRDQFGFAKDSFNVNLANQAQLLNNEMENRQRARLETSGKYGRDEAGQAQLQQELDAYTEAKKVSGKAI